MKKTNYRTSIISRPLTLILPILAILMLSTPALAAPIITISPTSGAIGTKVTVTGTNFESYRGDIVSIFLDNEEIATPLTVPQAESFSIDFNIPNNATPGRHWVRIRSDTGSTLASSLFIISETEISLDIAEGPVGTAVTINGLGFYGDKMVTFHYYDRSGEKLGTEIAISTGEVE